MSAGSYRRLELGSLADDLDQVFHTTARFDDPEPAEDLEALADDELVVPAGHGTLTGYASRGCRCEFCSAAMAEYRSKRRDQAAAQDAGGLSAGNGAIEAQEDAMSITSSERVAYERPAVSGRAKLKATASGGGARV